MSRIKTLAALSIVVAGVVLALKFAAYYVTGSIALYSDALESVINVATACFALYAIGVSERPADADHPYGHHKAEYFSAVLEGVLIIVAAFSILREAYFGFFNPRPLQAPLQGLMINGAAAIINAAWCWVLIREGRQLRSPALVADGRHLMTDAVTSAGIIAGLALVTLTGWTILDPALAALVALNILWSGWKLVKQSVGGLMDEAVAPSVLERIKHIISVGATGAIEAHDLRTRQAGRLTFIDFHLVVPGDMSVSEAHGICDDIERALKADVEDAMITIHVEPENKAKHAGIVVL